MKLIKLLPVLLVCWLVQPAGAQVLTFVDSEHDFGTIHERGGKVSYDYTFTNTGQSPLVIARIITSCKCVDASYNKKPVPAGGRGKITITYNPRKQRGTFYKAIQVYSNDERGRHLIIAKGEVESDDEEDI